MSLNIATDHFSQGFGSYENPSDHDSEGSVIFRFTRHEVATMDVRRFLGVFNLGKLEPDVIRSSRGSLVIHLPSSAARHEEPFLCETTRRFCQELRNVFPAWAFFFSLENLALWKMSLALLDHAQIIQSERAWQTRVRLGSDCLTQMIAQHLEQTRVVASRAQMPSSEIDLVLQAVRDYFTKVTRAYC